MAITGKPLAAEAGAMIFQKGGNAVDARERQIHLGSYVTQRVQRKIFVAVSFLRGFENPQQRSRPSPSIIDDVFNKDLLFGRHY